jgi:hypothetical protein
VARVTKLFSRFVGFEIHTALVIEFFFCYASLSSALKVSKFPKEKSGKLICKQRDIQGSYCAEILELIVTLEVKQNNGNKLCLQK